jgi:hypothetical protein
MKYWLVVYLLSPEGEYMFRDVYETQNHEQCVEFAGEVAKTLVNTNMIANFNCLNDEEYRTLLSL